MRINLVQGLKRLSLVFWSFVGFCFVASAAITIFSIHEIVPALGLLGLACVAYGGHRLTCWLIDGFVPKPGAPEQSK